MKQAIFLLFIFLISQNLVAQETESWKINAEGKLEVKLFPEEIIDAFILKRFGDGPWISDPIAKLPYVRNFGTVPRIDRCKFGLTTGLDLTVPLDFYYPGHYTSWIYPVLGITDKNWKTVEKQLHAEKILRIEKAWEIEKKWAQYESPKNNTKELFPEFAVDVSNILVWNAILTHQCGVGPWTDNDSGNWSGTVPHFFPEVLNPDNCVLGKNNLRTCESCFIARVLYPLQPYNDPQTIWRKPGGCRVWIWGRTSVQNRYALDPYLYFPKKAKYYYNVLANKKRAEIENQIIENICKKYGDQMELLKAQEMLLTKLGAHLEAKNMELQKKEQELSEFAEYILKLETVVANESAQVAKENIRLENEQVKLEKEKQTIAQEKTRFYSERAAMENKNLAEFNSARTALENKCAQLEKEKAQLIQDKTKEYNLESKNTQLEKEKKSLIQEREKNLAEFNNARTALQNKCAQLEKEKQTIAQEKTRFYSERAAMENKNLAEFNSARTALENKCAQLEKEKAQLIQDKTKEYNLESKNTQLEKEKKSLIQEREKNLAEFNNARTALQNKCAQLEKEKQALEQEKTQSQLEREKQSLVQENIKLRSEIKILNEKLEGE